MRKSPFNNCVIFSYTKNAELIDSFLNIFFIEFAKYCAQDNTVILLGIES